MGTAFDGIRLADLEAGAVAAGSLRGIPTVVLGAGRTGQAVAAFADASGARVTLHDTADAATLGAATIALKGSNVTFAFGHGHIGLICASTTGRLVAELVSGATPSIDPAPYRIDRF